MHDFAKRPVAALMSVVFVALAMTATGAHATSTPSTPLSLGLRLDATTQSAVHWPAQGPLLLYGLLLLFAHATSRRRRD